MYRNRARSVVLALSIFAAVGGLLPGSQAAAAPIPAPAAVSDVQLDASQTSGNWTMGWNTLTITPQGISHQPNRRTVYTFKFKATKGNLYDISPTLMSHYKTIAGDADAGFSAVQTPPPIAFLAEGSHIFVFVECIPPAGKYCDFAYVTVTSPSLISGASGVHPDDGKKV